MIINERILHFFNKYATNQHHTLNLFAKDIITFVPILMCAVVAVIFLVGIAKKDINCRRVAFSSLVFLIISLIVGFVISHIYYKPRPLFSEPSKVNAPVSHSNDSSLPSDHMTIGTSLTFGVFKFSKIIGIVFTTLTVIMLVTKLYLAQHYPSDLILTVVLIVVLRFVFKKWIEKPIIRFYNFFDKKLFGNSISI